jgi:mono/diheme cytochrome c family protein
MKMVTKIVMLTVGVIIASDGMWGGILLNAQTMDKGAMADRGMMGRQHGRGHKGNPVRHRVIRMGGGVPAPYTNMKNPVTEDAASIKAGQALYGEHCQSCHGKKGTGDGEAGTELKPKPANIAFIMDKWIATDPFLFWTISEGGESLKTAMPAFKDVLSDKQRWQIILYMRDEFTFGG